MIEFRSVTKRFPDDTVAVDDFNLVLPSHKTTVFVGSSGCGKTTLLRMVNRMVEPSSGQVLIDDVDVATQDKVKLRRSIGYVLQAAGLLPHRKVLDNVATVPMLNGVPKARGAGAGSGADGHRRAGPRARRALPPPAVRRPAATRRRRPGPGQRPEHLVDGRAVRRSRSDCAGRSADRAQPAAARAGQDDRVRHPRHRRGVHPGRPGRHLEEGWPDRPGGHPGGDPGQSGGRLRRLLHRRGQGQARSVPAAAREATAGSPWWSTPMVGRWASSTVARSRVVGPMPSPRARRPPPREVDIQQPRPDRRADLEPRPPWR